MCFKKIFSFLKGKKTSKVEVKSDESKIEVRSIEVPSEKLDVSEVGMDESNSLNLGSSTSEETSEQFQEIKNYIFSNRLRYCLRNKLLSSKSKLVINFIKSYGSPKTLSESQFSDSVDIENDILEPTEEIQKFAHCYFRYGMKSQDINLERFLSNCLINDEK